MTSAVSTIAGMFPAVYVAMTEAFPKLSPEQQTILQKGIVDNTVPFDAALDALVSLSPTLMAFDERAKKEYNVKYAALCPFLCWSLSQPGTHETPLLTLAGYVSHWRHRLGVSFYNASQNRAQFVVDTTEAMLDIRMHMSSAKKNNFRARFYDLAHRLSGFDGINKNTEFSIPSYMGDMGNMAIRCGNDTVDGSSPRREWFIALQKMHDFSDTPKRLALMHSIFESALDTSMQRDACGRMAPELWMEPTLQPYVSSLLASDETARLGQLAWTSDIEKNRALVSYYCPNIYPLIDLSLPPEDWARQDLVTRHFAVYSRPSKTYALPQNMDFS